jgi:outer membrane protein OmpA-like peptidoglycan-associated protein
MNGLKISILLGTAALTVSPALAGASAGHATGHASGGYSHTSQASGWYTSLQAGVNWLEDENILGTGNVGGCGPFCVWGENNPYGGIQFETGVAVAGAVGYAWKTNWNLEFELAYRENDIDCLTGAATTCDGYKGLYASPGHIWQFSQFVNVRYDFAFAERAYFGVGAGVGGTLVSAEDEIGFHADDYVVSGQLIGQLGYNLANRWDLYLDYRYMVTDEPVFTNLTYVSGKLDTSYYDVQNHSVMVGLRFDLQEECAPPAPPKETPPPPPPVAEVPREFIVFFGFNKFNLTADAQKVVAEAASAATQMNADAVVVIGHTDTVGSPKYNMELSERRAETVRSELIRQGVHADKISASGRGESDPMVQSGDNVREPQNRRASITIIIKGSTH